MSGDVIVVGMAGALARWVVYAGHVTSTAQVLGLYRVVISRSLVANDYDCDCDGRMKKS